MRALMRLHLNLDVEEAGVLRELVLHLHLLLNVLGSRGRGGGVLEVRLKLHNIYQTKETYVNYHSSPNQYLTSTSITNTT